MTTSDTSATPPSSAAPLASGPSHSPSPAASAAPPADRKVFDFAVRLAAAAGRRAAAGFFAEAGRNAARKTDGTEVTEVDTDVEAFVRGELAAAFPADAVHGEEGGPRPGTSGRRWIIDPLNGTKQFTEGDPSFAIYLAYEDESGPAVGVIHVPVSRRTVAAGRGLGCWLLPGDVPDPAHGRRLRVGERDVLTGARTRMHNPAGWPESLLTALHRRVFLTPSGGGVVDVVTGRADAWVIAGPAMGYEDCAPLPVIVAEAGGRVTDLAGAPVLAGDGSVLITNGLLHDAFLELVAEAGGHAMRAVVVDAHPGWAAEGRCLTTELGALLGPSALRVEHIGSTAVPGLDAKPVFDLQVGVADLPEAARAFDAPLSGAGFTRSPYEHDHVPAGRTDDPERWTKRLWLRRGGPGPDVNLHVRRVGSPNERLALLFRDWFRAHPEAVPAYARFKRELAHRVPGIDAYSDIKNPVVDLVIEVAEAWASATGWRP
ncbi:inositol monophosphatase family protein [Streptomyces celluloflavus]|uniref:inositol monophosphatase family protein n=1 Tax=Streptomyces celluloflavus TaxID=58344 RepID=UPI0036DDFCDD